ncbi:spermidine synthase [Ignisphaera sp. 4213-co]|uniref:Polyamine aminopropyltransferase n=1 Tax=Ignisphaera cupida TaxID=3050454 RepID=A0ABD4Z576_9CREN|nr:spermidine synthase [Ignisphaera sp. 4213-co]MDK6028461.1 spermidine synthase [Ignisphaera sp. 4213-co]
MLGTLIVQGIGKNSVMAIKVRSLIAIKKSPFQEIIVADVEEFGKALILDGYLQSTVADEFIYHESLVHPAMILHPNPKRVLIIGGGEGATLREVLKHNMVEEAVMVDIDKDVIELSKEYLPEMHQGSFFNKRSKVVIDDGKNFVEKEIKRGAQYDVVIMDLTDPYSSEIAKELYTKQFLEKISMILVEDGVFATQAGSRFFYREVYEDVANAAKNVFKYVAEYQVWIPSFGYSCNFIIGSKNFDTKILLNHENVDKVLRLRGVETRFINGKRIAAMLSMGIY